MCGIFAIAAKPEAGLDGRGFRDLVDRLFLLSETRGQEAAGLAVRTPETIEIYKQAGRPSRMLNGPNYAAFWKGLTDSDAPGTQVVVGHARRPGGGPQGPSTTRCPRPTGAAGRDAWCGDRRH